MLIKLNRSAIMATKINYSRLINIFSKSKTIKLKNLRAFSSVQNETHSKSNLFINPQVQEILTKITRIDMSKVYQPVQQRLSPPQYQFHTDEELQILMEEAKKKALEKLQMPPVLDKCVDDVEILSVDPEIQGYTDSNIVAIDITPGLMNIDRHIVVREPNGILRKASHNERDMMLKIYLPVKGRDLYTPKMFQDEYLQGVLERGWYEFALDRACIQFEPDDPEYIRVTQTVYSYVNEKRDFNHLRSTRHFGSMAYCLARDNNIDNLLMDMIEKEFLEDAVDLVKLHHLIHPDTESAKSAASQLDNFDLIMDFVQKDAKKKSYLELALQSLKELQEQRKVVEEGVKKAHGS